MAQQSVASVARSEHVKESREFSRRPPPAAEETLCSYFTAVVQVWMCMRSRSRACIRRRVKGSLEVECEEAVFGTFTQDLLRLRKWLRQYGVREVVMESTGVYWIPVWNMLEGRGLNLMLVNPATVRALRGRKTDRIDARRLAEYLHYGLLNGSFVPSRHLRQLRELTRMRVHVQQDAPALSIELGGCSRRSTSGFRRGVEHRGSKR